jgi:hypothetical protein
MLQPVQKWYMSFIWLLSYRKQILSNSHAVVLHESMSAEVGIASVKFVDPANLGILFGISRLSLKELEI